MSHPTSPTTLLGIATLFFGAATSIAHADSSVLSADEVMCGQHNPRVVQPPKATGSTDVTFLAFGDAQLGGKRTFDKNRFHVEALNELPAQISFGSSVVDRSEIRGVIMAGDITEYGNHYEYATPTRGPKLEFEHFNDLYGLCADGEVPWPLYEGYGNHDYPWTKDGVRVSEHPLVIDRVAARNTVRTGVLNRDDASGHYSWDWDGVHFVNLNLKASNAVKQHERSGPWAVFTDDSTTDDEGHYVRVEDPGGARSFLAKDLAAHVGGSKKAVVIITHYPLPRNDPTPLCDTNGDGIADVVSAEGPCAGVSGSLSGTTFRGIDALGVQEARDLYKVIRNYNVIAFIHGHLHDHSTYLWKGYPAYNVGSPYFMKNNDDRGWFAIFRIKRTRMWMRQVSYRMVVDGENSARAQDTNGENLPLIIEPPSTLAGVSVWIPPVVRVACSAHLGCEAGQYCKHGGDYDSCADVPAGFVERPDGSAYKLTTRTLLGRSARREATDLGGDLASINDDAEEAFLAEQFGGLRWVGYRAGGDAWADGTEHHLPTLCARSSAQDGQRLVYGFDRRCGTRDSWPRRGIIELSRFAPAR